MTQRDRILLAVVATLAVMGGFYLAVLKPTSTEVTDLDAQIVAAEQRRDTARQDLATAAAAREQYRQDQRTLAVLGKAVPSDDGVPSLLYQLHKAARKAGIGFDSVNVGDAGAAATASEDVTPGTVSGPEGLQALPLKISFSGTFLKLDRFLREVHKFARIGEEKVDVRGRLLTVESIDLKPTQADSSVLDAALVVNAYVAPVEGATTTATAGTASGATDAAASGTAAPAGDTTASTTASTGATE